MPLILSDYSKATSALASVLYDLPPRLIGIDGGANVGKTTLGRYLAWHFNVSLIEGDLFLQDGGSIEHRLWDIDRLIQERLVRERPVVLETILFLQVLEQIGRRADFMIYCENGSESRDDSMDPLLQVYESKYSPRTRAHLVLNLSLP